MLSLAEVNVERTRTALGWRLRQTVRRLYWDYIGLFRQYVWFVQGYFKENDKTETILLQ